MLNTDNIRIIHNLERLLPLISFITTKEYQ
jgi:hypothetical protein